MLITAGNFIIDRNDGYPVIPMSREFGKKHLGTEIRIQKPSNLAGVRIRQLEIHPAKDGSFIEAACTYEGTKTNLMPNRYNALLLDSGVDNFVTGAECGGATFILDGRHIKSIDRHYNKRAAEIKRELIRQNGQYWSRQLTRITMRRDDRVLDFLHKAAKTCINRAVAYTVER